MSKPWHMHKDKFALQTVFYGRTKSVQRKHKLPDLLSSRILKILYGKYVGAFQLSVPKTIHVSPHFVFEFMAVPKLSRLIVMIFFLCLMYILFAVIP